MSLFRIYALVALLNIIMYLFVMAEESGFEARYLLYTIHTGFLMTALARALQYFADPANYGGNPTVITVMCMVMLFVFEAATCYSILSKIFCGAAKFSVYSWTLAIGVLYHVTFMHR
ncbi:hypothetical protein TSUD_353700 [Trifolium subterraneum]|uniref:Uncharacterized protein n=1 Tax=Trifolium subterraneum TaxID=3900 RepID=A0A2Z6MWQ3_TRISU|nr:hypothetical protein TSUD_353700 [Trifolium subterraneum]